MSSILIDTIGGRRRLLRAGLVGAAGGAMTLLAGCASSSISPSSPVLTSGAPRVVRVVAKKFEFVPERIDVALGETVILEFTAPELPMGVNLPDLSQRVDVVPGRPARLQVTPTRAGTFVYTCDVFCGSGHEDMQGTLVVT